METSNASIFFISWRTMPKPKIRKSTCKKSIQWRVWIAVLCSCCKPVISKLLLCWPKPPFHSQWKAHAHL